MTTPFQTPRPFRHFVTHQTPFSLLWGNAVKHFRSPEAAGIEWTQGEGIVDAVEACVSAPSGPVPGEPGFGNYERSE